MSFLFAAFIMAHTEFLVPNITKAIGNYVQKLRQPKREHKKRKGVGKGVANDEVGTKIK